MNAEEQGLMNAEEIVSRVLYRDALMLVIDKPSGLPVHPGPKGGETLTHHLDALRFGLPRRPEAAHRLDRDTSGCLMLGRHPKALARLERAVPPERRSRRSIGRWSRAARQADEGEIDFAAVPKSPDRGWWMKVDPKGQPSLTRWQVLGRGDGHDASSNCARSPAAPTSCASIAPPRAGPFWAITIYGTAPRFRGPGLHLHARSVTVPLYPKKAGDRRRSAGAGAYADTVDWR